MRLQEGIDRVNFAIDNTAARKFDVNGRDVAMVMNEQQRSMVRKMAELAEGYINHTFTLDLTAARQIHNNTFSYRLPHWLLKIEEVRRSDGGSTFNLGPRIRRFRPRMPWMGWEHTANNELTLRNTSQAFGLEIYCSKTPARMTKGTLPAQGVIRDLVMDDDASTDAGNFPHDQHENAYAGALFEITGPASARVGQILRCVSNDMVTTGRTLVMEEDWTTQPETSDTYEMHSEIPEQHTELLILLTAQRLFAVQNNTAGIAAYARELSEQWRQFVYHVEKRQLQGPGYIGPGLDELLDTTIPEEWA